MNIRYNVYLGAKVIFFPKTSKFFLHFFTTKTKKSYNCAKLSVKIVQGCTILSVKGRFYNLPIYILRFNSNDFYYNHEHNCA